MKGYWSWGQIIALTIIYNFDNHILHIPSDNLTYFWVLPSLLSSLQLFYFGTFLPHSEPIGGYIQPHRSKQLAVQFGGHLSRAIILATTRNITNIPISLGGNYQK